MTYSPAYLRPHEENRVKAARADAHRAYPGTVGEVLARELGAWLYVGHRFDMHRYGWRLVVDIENRCLQLDRDRQTATYG